VTALRRIDGRREIALVPTCRAACAAIVVLGFLAAPVVAPAQPPSKVPRVGVIGEASPTDPFHTAFRQGLRELGYTEGRSIVIEYRHTHGALEKVPKLAAELVRLDQVIQ